MKCLNDLVRWRNGLLELSGVSVLDLPLELAPLLSKMFANTAADPKRADAISFDFLVLHGQVKDVVNLLWTPLHLLVDSRVVEEHSGYG